MQEALAVLSVAQIWTGIMAKFIIDYNMCDISDYTQGMHISDDKSNFKMSYSTANAISVRGDLQDTPAYLALGEGGWTCCILTAAFFKL